MPDYHIEGFDAASHDGLPAPKPKPLTAAQRKRIAAMAKAQPLPYTPADRIKAKKLPWKKGRITDFQQY